MPYIENIDKIREALKSKEIKPSNVGELNYLITSICHEYIISKGLKYSIVNEVIGVLECCKLELYRQIISPYENIKKSQNGPVSELDAKV